ncbi:hypothetical protein BDD21_3367 [Thiocapsa rosea]|uniref:Reverse transcriptase (RNA-dependent DNA polymerase) n=2 Tax=Thiocapsa rosea TaxID=69360 RepID=A0A495V916_9GAMM|nr:hypothetical protein BDD21_3367 [Thiocapsa rosea]
MCLWSLFPRSLSYPTSFYHHVCDVDHLRACFDALPADRAVGIDAITKERYGANLEENFEVLLSRLRNMGYRPQPKRRTYIPKPGSEKGRPLAISCFEDKLVELAIKRVLEPLYEVQFEDSSYGCEGWHPVATTRLSRHRQTKGAEIARPDLRTQDACSLLYPFTCVTARSDVIECTGKLSPVTHTGKLKSQGSDNDSKNSLERAGS